MRTSVRATALLGVVLLAAGAADGGMLATDANGMSAWRGTQAYYAEQYSVVSHDTQVDYCVYTPGDFSMSFPGEAVPADRYVYAYQVTDLVEGLITRFSVGLDDDEQAAGIAAIAGTGDVSPSNSAFAAKTAGWDFNPSIEAPGTSSSLVLYYTSPFSPEEHNASTTGKYGWGDTHPLPSPTPEPATLALFGGAMAYCLGLRRRGRV